MTDEIEELLTVQEVMLQLKVSDETVYRWIKARKISAIRLGGLWRVSRKALDEFIQQGGSQKGGYKDGSLLGITVDSQRSSW